MIASTTLHPVTLVLYVAAFAVSVAAFTTRSAGVRRLAISLTGMGMVAHLVGLGAMWSEDGAFPVGRPIAFFGLYALASFFWALLVCRHWDIENTYFSFMAIPLIGLIVVWAVDPVKSVAPTMSPAWLTLHLAAIIASLAAFTVAFSGGVMLWLQDRLMKAKQFGFLMENLPSLEVLDELTYRNVSLGFVSLSLGTLLGFSAAPKAWGSYMPVDARVGVSLAAWAMYGFYLHTRSRRGWRGRKLAVVSLGGFLVILAIASVRGGFHGS
jgi:ABC-type transport system involved in cytochrome c biogenesis permease subunit